MDIEKLSELVREHSELYDLSNSKYSGNLHEEKVWEKTEEEIKHNGKSTSHAFLVVPHLPEHL